MKGAKRVINAILSYEMNHIDEVPLSNHFDDYMVIETNSGFFWGKMAKDKIKNMKSKAEKIST